MVARIHYRWDFIGLSTDNKPTPETSEKVVDGSTYYCSDNSKLYVWYKTQWYERKPLGGGGGGGSYTAGTGIDITDDTISVDTTTIQAKLTAGDNITITDDTISATDTTYTAGSNITITNGEISATDTTYSNFTGTDGTAAGTAGLVPAPAATDTDKYLKSDGSWATVSGGGGTTYTAGDGIDITNAVISATNTGKAKVLTTDDYNYNSSTGTTTNPNCVALWLLDPGLYTVNSSSVMTVRASSEIPAYIPGVCLVTETHSNGNKSLFCFADNGATRMTVFVVNVTNGSQQYEATNALQSYVDNKIKTNAGAPTTATTGTVGQLLEDTTNGKLYICTDTTGGSYTWVEVGAGGGGSGIVELTSADYNYPANDPTSVALWLLENGIYYATDNSVNVIASTNVADSVDQGVYIVADYGSASRQIEVFSQGTSYYGSYRVNKSTGARTSFSSFLTPIISQSTGTSTTDVMSQNAVTSMVFGSNTSRVQIGNQSSSTAANAIAIGDRASASGQNTTALGSSANGGSYNGGLALGAYSGSNITSAGIADIGSSSTAYGYNSSSYRLLTGLYDPQGTHDAATKGYVDPTTDSSAPTTATVGRLGQIFIDTTNAAAYMCVAVDSVTPSYTWKQITV